MNPIAVHHIWKSYGSQSVLRDVSVEAAADTVTCVMAPSGRGKTTLLRIFLGLEAPDRGTVETPSGWRWAAVFQEDRLLEDLDARGNLRFVLGREYDETRARTLLAELGLGETAGRAVREFSGGMKRRLALARALLVPADALALDEPFTGLDQETRRDCREILLREAAGRPVLLVTHDSTDGAALGARLVRL